MLTHLLYELKLFCMPLSLQFYTPFQDVYDVYTISILLGMRIGQHFNYKDDEQRPIERWGERGCFSRSRLLSLSYLTPRTQFISGFCIDQFCLNFRRFLCFRNKNKVATLLIFQNTIYTESPKPMQEWPHCEPEGDAHKNKQLWFT